MTDAVIVEERPFLIAERSKVQVAPADKLIGLCFDVYRSNDTQTQLPIEAAMSYEQAMVLLQSLQEVQRIYKIPMPVGILEIKRTGS